MTRRFRRGCGTMGNSPPTGCFLSAACRLKLLLVRVHFRRQCNGTVGERRDMSQRIRHAFGQLLDLFDACRCSRSIKASIMLKDRLSKYHDGTLEPGSLMTTGRMSP